MSYTAPSGVRQPFAHRGAALVALVALAAAGCSATAYDPSYTGSIVRNVAEGVDPSDWEMVRRAVAEIGDEAFDRTWRNPATGSSGTVSAAPLEPRGGGVCRGFATTVNDVRGVRSYRGEACRSGGEEWRIGAIVPEDGVLL